MRMAMHYFDHNASSPLRPEVFEAMMPYLTAHQANASSLHRPGRIARQAIETAREQVAHFIHADPNNIIFTSGGTEANTLFLQGIARAKGLAGHFALSAIEHASVLETASDLIAQGWQATYLPVDEQGCVLIPENPPSYDFVSIMMANNETGVLQDIPRYRKIFSASLFHTDVSQAVGRIPVDFKAMDVDALSFSAHKMGGPKGVGVLAIRSNVPLQANQLGGGQERGYRAGTENVPAIVGLGALCAQLSSTLHERRQSLTHLQSYLERGLKNVPGIQILGEGSARLPNTTLCAFSGFTSEMLVMELDKRGFAVSGGAACGQAQISHVLKAMNVPEEQAMSAIRISLSDNNTESEINDLLSAIENIQEKWMAQIGVMR